MEEGTEIAATIAPVALVHAESRIRKGVCPVCRMAWIFDADSNCVCTGAKVVQLPKAARRRQELERAG